MELYSEFPASSFVHLDKPDFIVTTLLGETIGIEVTDAIYSRQSEMKKSEYQIKINKLVLEQLNKCLPFKFVLNIVLGTEPDIGQANIKSVINSIVEVSFNEFYGLNNLQTETISNFGTDINTYPESVQQMILSKGYRTLPNGIRYIRLGRYDILDKSFHGKNKGGFVPNFQPELLETILAEKHKSLQKYMRCDQQWLLIAEGSDFCSYFDNINIETTIDTQFDKVFMVRTFPRIVVVLKE